MTIYVYSFKPLLELTFVASIWVMQGWESGHYGISLGDKSSVILEIIMRMNE